MSTCVSARRFFYGCMLFQRNKPPDDPKALGRWGEVQAKRYLQNAGLSFLQGNYRCPTGEIDLIMVDSDRTLVFVEVKTRTNESFQALETAITYPKQQRMIRAARRFVRQHDLRDRPYRFDVVVLSKADPADIRHYVRAFVP